MADIAIIEPGALACIGRALRQRLEVAFTPNKFTHQWMPSRIDRDVWQKLARKTPMVAIGFNRITRVQTISQLNAMSEWTIYLATMNETSPEAVLFGDKFAPGQLALAEVAASILHGWTVLGLGSIQVTEGSNAFIEDYKADGLAITAIDIGVPVDLSLSKVLTGDAVAAGQIAASTIQWAFGGDTLTDLITNTGTS